MVHWSKKCMKVLIFFPSINRGGIEKNLISWHKALTDLGVDVHVICLSNNNNKIHFKNFYQSRSTYDAIKRVNKSNYDFIFVFRGIILPVLLKLIGHKIYYRLNNSSDHWKHEKSIKRCLSEFTKKITYQFADGLIANSQELKRQYQSYNEKIYLVRNYFKSNYRKNQYLVNNSFILVGRLEHQKNPNLAIRAFMELGLENSILHIYGDGSMLQDLREKYKNNNIKFMGWVDNIPYYNYKYYLMSSRYEGSPNALIEAMSSGCIPIITPFKTGGKELIYLAGCPNYCISKDFQVTNYKSSIRKVLKQEVNCNHYTIIKMHNYHKLKESLKYICNENFNMGPA